MINGSIKEIAKLFESNLEGTEKFSGVSIDTRTLVAGNLFVALKGEQFDGHDYVAKAKELGAVAATLQQLIDIDFPQIIVKDSTLALGELACFWRAQFKIPFVGVTGSCGKTTTTQMIGSILNQVGKTLVPQGNKNNQIGVPLTLFNLSSEHEFAVIEMGADRGGEIKYSANIVHPDVSVITNVAPVHLEVSEGIGFGSIEGVFNEKSEIFRALKSSGVAIINADDDYFPQWKAMMKDKKTLSFGYSSHADVTVKNLHQNEDLQYSFTLITPEGSVEVLLSSLGRHNVINAMAAAAAALSLGIPLQTIARGLGCVPTMARRMIRVNAKKGAILIDDSYNANVKSVKAVLEMLADHPGQKIMVFGDMLEIGEQSSTFHSEVGEYAKTLGIDYFYGLGKDAEYAVKAFGINGKHFSVHADLVSDVLEHLEENTMVIVKGSFGMKLDKVVEGLKA
jgi:UDP-N-acetylmuramoyl-tripeptide--D-alanyl-D-alanine ligase